MMTAIAMITLAVFAAYGAVRLGFYLARCRVSLWHLRRHNAELARALMNANDRAARYRSLLAAIERGQTVILNVKELSK